MYRAILIVILLIELVVWNMFIDVPRDPQPSPDVYLPVGTSCVENPALMGCGDSSYR